MRCRTPWMTPEANVLDDAKPSRRDSPHLRAPLLAIGESEGAVEAPSETGPLSRAGGLLRGALCNGAQSVTRVMRVPTRDAAARQSLGSGHSGPPRSWKLSLVLST